MLLKLFLGYLESCYFLNSYQTKQTVTTKCLDVQLNLLKGRSSNFYHCLVIALESDDVKVSTQMPQGREKKYLAIKTTHVSL